MAIARTTDTETELVLRITNGDLAALKTIKSSWRFRNLEDVIRFALAVMVKSDDHAIIVKRAGETSTLSPADELLEPKPEGA